MQKNEELILKQTYETATLGRRFMAFLIDLLLVLTITYLAIVILKLFKEIDHFFELFEASQNDIENREKYIEMINLFWKLILNIYLTWLGSNLIYYTLVPAIIGNGRTIGKLLAGIGVVDVESLEEISPSRLVLREFVGRVFLQYVLIIPLIISLIISFVREDSRSLQDLIAKTVVIKLDLYEIN